MALPTLRRSGSPVTVRRADSGNGTGSIAQWNPWREFDAMSRFMDSLFPTPFTFSTGTNQAREHFDPTVELYETSDDLIAYIYAPGMASDSFDIAASADSLSIKAERKPLQEASENLISHTPWANWATSQSTFSASYSLPVEIDPAQVRATYKDGVLQVTLPKAEAAKPKQVKVNVDHS